MLLSEEHPETKQYVLGEGGVLVLMELMDSANPEVCQVHRQMIRNVDSWVTSHTQLIFYSSAACSRS
jgi:hypothetical protein